LESKLSIEVISCSNLPDCDLAGIGFGNKSDPYVIVKVGKDGKPQQTKAVAGKLNPVFPKGTSTFTFDVEDATKRRIFFEVMDKDTFTKDDLIGKASIKLSKGQVNGILLSLALQTKEEEDSDEGDD
jgi:Ca2+-dependent lipid-binding protein